MTERDWGLCKLQPTELTPRSVPFFIWFGKHSTWLPEARCHLLSGYRSLALSHQVPPQGARRSRSGSIPPTASSPLSGSHRLLPPAPQESPTQKSQIHSQGPRRPLLPSFLIKSRNARVVVKRQWVGNGYNWDTGAGCPV